MVSLPIGTRMRQAFKSQTVINWELVSPLLKVCLLVGITDVVTAGKVRWWRRGRREGRG